MKQQILDFTIKLWNERLVGISALDIAEKLEIPHLNVMTYLEELKSENKGTLNENAKLFVISIEPGKKLNLSNSKKVKTHIFFPSKEILSVYFENNLNEFNKNGEYKNRQHKGYSPIDLIYFDQKVLIKYLSDKEKYELNDDVSGGVIKLSSEFYSNSTEAEIDKEWFDKIWYGKRKLNDGKTVVAAILKDLSSLKVKEQSYWYGFETDNTSFDLKDNDFSKFVSRAYEGNWTESNDPIREIKNSIESINKTLQFKLYGKSENPYLRYPLNNTFKDFVDCNSELYKLIGPDNLRLSKVKKLYLELLNGNIESLTHKSGRSLSSIQIMELIMEELNDSLSINFKKIMNVIKENRIEGDHKITIPNSEKVNYVNKFREYCEEIKNFLIKFELEIKKSV
jgi:hypothetical protein